MQLTHRFRLPAPVEEVFAALSQLEQLAACVPGATVTEHGEDGLVGSLAVKLGPAPLLYTGTARLRDVSRLRHRLILELHGRDSRRPGSALAVLTVHLSGHGPATDVEVHTEIELTGPAARYGTTVLSEAADKLVDQVSRALAVRLAPGRGDGAGVGIGGSGTGVVSTNRPGRRAGPVVVGSALAVAGVSALGWVGLRLVRRFS